MTKKAHIIHYKSVIEACQKQCKLWPNGFGKKQPALLRGPLDSTLSKIHVSQNTTSIIICWGLLTSTQQMYSNIFKVP